MGRLVFQDQARAVPGEATLKSHWLSFDSSGKHAATGEALAAELPAEPDEFPLVTAEEAAPSAGEVKQKKEKKLRSLR